MEIINMDRRQFWKIMLILVSASAALLVVLNNQITLVNPITQEIIFSRDVSPRLGLDLQGGVQVLLEADLPADAEIDAADMEVARTIIENRTNALGVAENLIQKAGDRRIVGEFPGVQDTDAILSTIQQTGLLEFVDTGSTRMESGTVIQTDYSPGGDPITADGVTVFHTLMTGSDLKSAAVATDQLGKYIIQFELTPEGGIIFGDHTSANIGKILTIVLDKQVISSPSINGAITEGSGIIEGQFTYDEVNDLAIKLRYGSLPIPLKILETRIIGPTLGEDSLRKSLIAGAIGMLAVFTFMALFYRFPGFIAIIGIIFYSLIAFAIFKYIPVTLTLAGIAGFLLSTGAALDANILIFERIKEELRNGKTMTQSLDQGWTRARSSIFDSNIATLITSAILFWFGSTFGATIVKGFSLTLAIGVVISLFTAIVVTRTLLAISVRNIKFKNINFWFGL
jgi:preprotein translocase subunit SecD